jgi:hypothetical protein
MNYKNRQAFSLIFAESLVCCVIVAAAQDAGTNNNKIAFYPL